MLTGSITFLSGRWCIKLALARAMLQNADILVMDEPTKHLDAINVNWIGDYIHSMKDVKSIVVSHEKGLFCAHYLTVFVNKVPKAKSLFEMKESKLKIASPKPGNLDGITSNGKSVINMDQVTFT